MEHSKGDLNLLLLISGREVQLHTTGVRAIRKAYLRRTTCSLSPLLSLIQCQLYHPLFPVVNTKRLSNTKMIFLKWTSSPFAVHEWRRVQKGRGGFRQLLSNLHSYGSSEGMGQLGCSLQHHHDRQPRPEMHHILVPMEAALANTAVAGNFVCVT